MITAKSVILIAIAYHGINKVRENAGELARNALCSKSHVLKIVRDVEKKRITIQTQPGHEPGI